MKVCIECPTVGSSRIGCVGGPVQVPVFLETVPGITKTVKCTHQYQGVDPGNEVYDVWCTVGAFQVLSRSYKVRS